MTVVKVLHFDVYTFHLSHFFTVYKNTFVFLESTFPRREVFFVVQ